MNRNLYDSVNRDHVIDFTKGFLVVTMVAYHTLNYFLVYGRHILFEYVNYVVVAFIFYSGFMCGTIYFKKFRENKKYVYYRLAIRGLKLVILFFVLNLIIHSLFIKGGYEKELGIAWFFNNFDLILLTGGRIAHFPILLPIAYVLIISAMLINFSSVKYLLYLSLFASFCIITFYKINLPYNLLCTLIGIGGLFTGLIYIDKESILKNTFIRYTGILLLLFYLILLIPSGMDVRDYVIVYFIYINLIIVNLHLLGGYLEPSKIMTKFIIKFGQYSLFLYIAQIFFLQVLKRIFNFQLVSVTIDHLLIFVSTNIFLIICYYMTDYLRNKITFIDKSYRLIFQ